MLLIGTFSEALISKHSSKFKINEKKVVTKNNSFMNLSEREVIRCFLQFNTMTSDLKIWARFSAWTFSSNCACQYFFVYLYNKETKEENLKDH